MSVKKILLPVLALIAFYGSAAGQNLGLAARFEQTPSMAALLTFEKHFSLRAGLVSRSSYSERTLTVTNFTLSGDQVKTERHNQNHTHFGLNLAGIMYFHSTEMLMPYLGIEAGLERRTALTPVVVARATVVSIPGIDVPIPVPGEAIEARKASAGLLSTGLFFGAQLPLSKQFHVFGEFGVEFQTGETINDYTGQASPTRVLGLKNAGAGIIFYL